MANHANAINKVKILVVGDSGNVSVFGDKLTDGVVEA